MVKTTKYSKPSHDFSLCMLYYLLALIEYKSWWIGLLNCKSSLSYVWKYVYNLSPWNNNMFIIYHPEIILCL